jgi:hypothetical protein
MDIAQTIRRLFPGDPPVSVIDSWGQSDGSRYYVWFSRGRASVRLERDYLGFFTLEFSDPENGSDFFQLEDLVAASAGSLSIPPMADVQQVVGYLIAHWTRIEALVAGERNQGVDVAAAKRLRIARRKKEFGIDDG